MKKLFFAISYFFISLSITAQKTSLKINPADDFCERLSEIMGHAYSNFKEINTREQQAPEETYEDGFEDINFFDERATLEFPGAKLSSIHLNTDYSAFFGIYKTKNEATKKIDSIKSQLIYCLKNYKITNEPLDKEPYYYTVRYVLKEIRNDKIKPRELELYAEKIRDDGRFKIKLEIKGFNQ
jgi:hypothetical protein